MERQHTQSTQDDMQHRQNLSKANYVELSIERT